MLKFIRVLCVLLSVFVLFTSATIAFAQDESTVRIACDVDGDGKITAFDARLALRFSAKLINFNEEQQTAADVDRDGIVTASDARRILRISVGLELGTFQYPDPSAFKLTMDAIPKTEFKVGETLKITTRFTNTAKQSYGIVRGYLLVEAWLTKDGDGGFGIPIPQVIQYLEAEESIVSYTIFAYPGKKSEEFTFTEPGTYTLQVKSSFSVIPFSGTSEAFAIEHIDTTVKRDYSYSLESVKITVTL